jgi:signal peptidase I
MYPTLVAGEYVLFNRLTYSRGNPKRGDVVLVRGILEGDRAIIKRVAGIPGDTLQLERGMVMVNGLPAEDVPSPGETELTESQESGPWELGDDDYFLLGDARDMSTDSRSFGPVPRGAIKGRAWLVYWPLSRWRRLDRG